MSKLTHQVNLWKGLGQLWIQEESHIAYSSLMENATPSQTRERSGATQIPSHLGLGLSLSPIQLLDTGQECRQHHLDVLWSRCSVSYFQHTVNIQPGNELEKVTVMDHHWKLDGTFLLCLVSWWSLLSSIMRSFWTICRDGVWRHCSLVFPLLPNRLNKSVVMGKE